MLLLLAFGARLFALDLGAARLDSLQEKPSERIQRLDSVMVNGSNVTHYAGRDVIRITRELRKGARNVAQMLGKIPGFDCDRSSNSVTYYGSDEILILVDSIEKPAGYVKELHHLRFDKVVVVPNPTGKYAGYNVLVNFHTKQDYEGHEENFFNYFRALPTDGNGSGKNLSNTNTSSSFTYTKNKWNVVGRYNFGFRQGELSDVEKTETYPLNQLRYDYLRSTTRKDSYFRIHNLYTALDYQIGKNHSVSLSYQFAADASDDYQGAGMARTQTETGRKDSIWVRGFDGINSKRHTLGGYFRGRSGAWNYTFDVNYINDGWSSESFLERSTGYASYHHLDNLMNYIWTKSELNRHFLKGKLYVSAGYNLTLKKYEQTDRLTKDRLSANNYLRNEFWTWMSYYVKDGTDVNFSASAEHVHSRSDSFADNDMVYKLSGMVYHRWNKWLWMRLNLWCDVNRPQLRQVSEYGYFTDSLNWVQGNPGLKTSVSHSGRVWLDFFNTFNLQAGFAYSPNTFCTVTESREGTLASGERLFYVAYVPRNTRFHSFWTSFYIQKRIGKLTMNAFVKYEKCRAEYAQYKSRNDGFSGNMSLRYYEGKRKLSLSLSYSLANQYDVAVQGKTTRRLDYFNILAGKDFLKQRLGVVIQYVPPLFFTAAKYFGCEDSPAEHVSEAVGLRRSNGNALMLTVSYRLWGGKSVRQYTRNMSEEK